MEQMTENDSNSIESEQTKKDVVNLPDRVSLTKENSDKLDGWLHQVVLELGEFIKVTKTDLINFLVESHIELLSSKELKSIKLKHYDELKFSMWVTQRLREARKTGEAISLSDLVKNKSLKESAVAGDLKPKVKRKKTAKTDENSNE